MNKYYAFMHWGKYETQFDIDKLPYDIERLEKTSQSEKRLLKSQVSLSSPSTTEDQSRNTMRG